MVIGRTGGPLRLDCRRSVLLDSERAVKLRTYALRNWTSRPPVQSSLSLPASFSESRESLARNNRCAFWTIFSCKGCLFLPSPSFSDVLLFPSLLQPPLSSPAAALPCPASQNSLSLSTCKPLYHFHKGCSRKGVHFPLNINARVGFISPDFTSGPAQSLANHGSPDVVTAPPPPSPPPHLPRRLTVHEMPRACNLRSHPASTQRMAPESIFGYGLRGCDQKQPGCAGCEEQGSVQKSGTHGSGLVLIELRNCLKVISGSAEERMK